MAAPCNFIAHSTLELHLPLVVDDDSFSRPTGGQENRPSRCFISRRSSYFIATTLAPGHFTWRLLTWHNLWLFVHNSDAFIN